MIWSIYLRNQDLPEGGDNLARILLLFMVFTVSNAYLAPGAKRRRATLESTSRRRPAIPLPHNAAARAMLVQIAVLYFVAGYLKATADIWSKRATLRKLVTVSLAGMHLGIMVRMGLVAFGLIMIGADSMILTDHDYQTVTGLRRAAGANSAGTRSGGRLMSLSRWWWGRAWPVIWCVVVALSVFDGVTATDPGSWAGTLLTLVFFTIMSWRFFRPSLSIAPTPLAALTAIGTLAVAARGAWLHGSPIDGFTSSHAWSGLALAVLAAAIAAPFTGVATPMTGELVFPIREGRWRVVGGWW
ncbi:MAG: hypothetical protein WBN99_08790 [Mycobacterium sp.]